MESTGAQIAAGSAQKVRNPVAKFCLGVPHSRFEILFFRNLQEVELRKGCRVQVVTQNANC